MKKIPVGDTKLNVFRAGSGPPLLLVHGFPLDHQMWQGQIDDLSRSFDVIAPDLRGFGLSRSTAELVTMEQYADDLADLLDALGIDAPIAFCGLSMGGYIAWQFWKRHRDRLSHLVLCDTRAAADSPEAAQARGVTADRVLEEGPAFLLEGMLAKLFSKQTFRLRGSLVEKTAQVIRTASRSGVAAALRGMAVRPDATGWLPRITVPVLLVCGQEDVLTEVSEMEAVADQIPGAQLAVIPGCGHMAPLEDPVHVNKTIRAFFELPHN